MANPKRKKLPSWIKPGALVRFDIRDAVVIDVDRDASDPDEVVAVGWIDGCAEAQWCSVSDVLPREGARMTDADDADQRRATYQPQPRDRWEHEALGTVTVARVEGGMVCAYAARGPAETAGAVRVPVSDWWAFVADADLLEPIDPQ